MIACAVAKTFFFGKVQFTSEHIHILYGNNIRGLATKLILLLKKTNALCQLIKILIIHALKLAFVGTLVVEM